MERETLIRHLADLRGQNPSSPQIARLADEFLKRGNKILAGRYEILEKLGEGGMGKVYKARDLKLDRVVALKGLGRTDPADLDRFSREARLASTVHHANVVEVYDLVTDGDNHFITMRYIKGDSLDAIIGYRNRPLRALVESLAQAADGLEQAHRQGVIHRDIKPGNILVDATDRAYLSDFGLARRQHGGTRVTTMGAILGTPAYMSPEQAQGREVDALSDVYGLGATLYEILTGSTPFRGDQALEVLTAVVHTEPPRPTTRDPKIPKPLEVICLKALSKEKARRYASAAEFAADLRRWMNHEPILASPPSVAFRLQRFARRRTMALIVAAALVALGVAGYFLVRGKAQSDTDKTTIAKGEKYRRLQERLNPVAGIIKETRLMFYIPNVDLVGRLKKVEESLYDLQRLALEAETEGVADPEPWILAGMGWYFVGDFRRAEMALRRGEALAPKDGRPAFYLGKIVLEQSMANAFEPEKPGAARTGPGGWSEKANALFAKADLLGSDATDVDRAIVKAYQALAKANYDEVIRLCNDGIARHADALGSEEFWLLKALVQVDDEARVESCTRAIQRRPHFAWAYFIRGTMQSDRGKIPAAIDDMTKALSINGRMAAAFGNRGFYQEMMGNQKAATEDMDRAVQADPENPRSYFNRANFNRLKGRFDAALDDYDKALSISPQFVEALNNRGVTKRNVRDFDGALADARASLAIEPKNASSLLARSQTFLAAGRMGDAKADLERALLIDPHFHEAYFCLGNILETEGIHGEALEAYSKALEYHPGYSPALVNRGVVYMQLGKLDLAIADFDAVLKKDPVYLGAWTNRGNARRMMGDLDGAIADLNEALKLNPESPDALNSRASAQLGKKNYAAAHADCDAALKLRPNYAEALINRAAARDGEGDPNGALLDYNQGLSLNPRDYRAWYNRALLKIEVKDAEGAIEDLTRAIEIRPKYPTALYVRATLYWAKKDATATKADLEAALECAPADWSYRKKAEDFLAKLKKAGQ